VRIEERKKEEERVRGEAVTNREPMLLVSGMTHHSECLEFLVSYSPPYNVSMVILS
jgi:hypothetical protein